MSDFVEQRNISIFMFQVLQILGELWFLWEMSKPLYLASPSLPLASDPMAKESTMHPSPSGPLVMTSVPFSWLWSLEILQKFPPIPLSRGQGASDWHSDPGQQHPLFLLISGHRPLFPWGGKGNFWEASQISLTQVMGFRTYQHNFWNEGLSCPHFRETHRPQDSASASSALSLCLIASTSCSGFQTFFLLSSRIILSKWTIEPKSNL